MPIYTIEDNGRTYRIEADTEDDAFAILDEEVGAQSEAPSGGMGKLGAMLLGGAGVAGALALRRPDLAKKVGSKAFETLQGARYLGALSGMAVPKSVVGNVGAPFVAAAERKSLEPIKQFFKPETVKTWVREMRNPEVGRELAEKGTQTQLRFNPMGRVMSAGDVATRGALKRAGMTETEAARYTLQSSLPEMGITGDFATALESPAARYSIMFRRTPLNQLVHGFKSTKDRPALAALAAGTGAAQGSADGVAGDPFTIAATAPAAGVYSLPYLIGAGAGKVLAGKNNETELVTRGLAPIPEFGKEFLSPLRPIDRPAAMSAYERLQRLLTTGRSY